MVRIVLFEVQVARGGDAASLLGPQKHFKLRLEIKFMETHLSARLKTSKCRNYYNLKRQEKPPM
ncbi:hypothetical protein DQM28_16705 [Leptospira mayottensis]|uniref:Uncharacterized protein n=1 Tax=Leptospira mayottensis TaxID=1137606 RepID=A0ABN5NXT4_9LEPT|nr:hypothetical protein DQM28_16705 [Leptospira mayottensis]